MLLEPIAHINLQALRHNLAQAKALAPDAKVMAALKADGYGHGLCKVASALDRADGFAVAHLQEAKQLRDNGCRARLLLLSGLLDGEGLTYCAQHDIDIVVHTPEAAALLAGHNPPAPLNVWFKHDSGMHRLGLSDRAMRETVSALATSPNVRKHCYMTHFSGSDEKDETRTREQIQRFNTAIDGLPPAPLSLANSAAVIKGNQGGSGWIRPGIMLYGANPLDPDLYSTFPVDLRPVMTLKAPVIAIREIPAGDAVGYNSRWTASRPSTIATIGIGYGDGYPRHAINGTPVLLNGQRVSLVGTVSMDMLTVDITDCGGIRIGDEATLWGDGLGIEEIARCASTISYELLTSINKRVPRIYTD